MNAKLKLIQKAIAVAQMQLANLKGSSPEDIRVLPEIDDLELGLQWIMKRADTLRIYLDTQDNRHAIEYATNPGTVA